MKNRTKLMFVEELEKMLRTKTFSKIRILDLCERCGASPPTFYYHFQDKYELAAWAFVNDFAGVAGNQEPEYSVERLTGVLKQMEKKKDFYCSVFQDKSQNSICRYIQDFNEKMGEAAVRYAFHQDTLTDDQALAVQYHSYGIIGVFQEWIFGRNTLSAERLATFYYEHTPDFLRKALQVYPLCTAKLLENTEPASQFGEYTNCEIGQKQRQV